MARLRRFFSTEQVKGARRYLDTQKKYEILRTALYFGVSLALFAAGFLQTGSRGNLLTVVAVLGCLPASKSAVAAVMFLRFRSCAEQTASQIEAHSQGICCLYDMVFTSYKRNYVVSHMAVRGNTVCGFSEDGKFPEGEFYRHIGDILKLDGHKNVTVKIFTSLPKYTERLDQMAVLAADGRETSAVIATLKAVAL